MIQNRRIPLIALALTLLVAALGYMIQGGALGSLDFAISNAFSLQRGANPDAAISFWQAISWIGGGARRYLLAAALAGWLAWRGWRVRGVALIAATLVGNLLSDGLKDWFDRARPALVPHLDHASSASFPSGHATSAALIAFGFALLVPTAHRRRWITAAAAYAVLMSASRVMLGVHWTSDVAAGLMLGIAVALVTGWAAITIEARQSNSKSR